MVHAVPAERLYPASWHAVDQGPFDPGKAYRWEALRKARDGSRVLPLPVGAEPPALEPGLYRMRFKVRYRGLPWTGWQERWWHFWIGVFVSGMHCGMRLSAACLPAEHSDPGMPKFSYNRRLPYPREAVFDLVADVERYPEFLPGWRSARIVDRSGDVLTVEQSLGGRGFQWRFQTTATLDRPVGIHIQTREHPFEYLDQRWRFEAAGEHATQLTLDAAYELRGLPLRRLVSLVFDEGFRRTLRAFEARAREKLGQAVPD